MSLYCFCVCARPLKYLGWWGLLSVGDLSGRQLENNWYHAAIGGQNGMIEKSDARQRIGIMRFPFCGWVTHHCWTVILCHFIFYFFFFLYIFSLENRHTDLHKMILALFFFDFTNRLKPLNNNYRLYYCNWVIQPLLFSFFFLKNGFWIEWKMWNNNGGVASCVISCFSHLDIYGQYNDIWPVPHFFVCMHDSTSENIYTHSFLRTSEIWKICKGTHLNY